MSTQTDVRQSLWRATAVMIGGSANISGDTLFANIDSLSQKLVEDRNVMLSDGGTIALDSTGVTLSFTQNLYLNINQTGSGGTPTAVNLGSSSVTFTSNGYILYATVNRTAGTATLSTVSASTGLPAATNANQDIFLIAVRKDSADGTKTVYMRDGTAIVAGSSGRLGVGGSGGGSGANTALSNLASVAVNASLIAGTGSSIDLGSSSKTWANLYADTAHNSSILVNNASSFGLVSIGNYTTNPTQPMVSMRVVDSPSQGYGFDIMQDTSITGDFYINAVNTSVSTEALRIARATGQLILSGGLKMNAAGSIRLADSGSTNYMGFQAPSSLSGSTNFTLPNGDGATGAVLSTNGSGTLSWATSVASAGSVTGTNVVGLSNLVQATAYSVLGNSTSGSANYSNLQSLILGTPGFTATGVAIQQSGNSTSYFQSILQNKTSGTGASADFIVSNNLGTDTTYYGDLGMNSSTFTGTGSLNLANAVYLYSQTGDLSIGTNTANAVHLLANNSATDAITINSSNAIIFPGLTGYVYANGSSALSAATTIPGSAISGNITGNAANITATSNSTLTTLSALSLPTSQLSGTINLTTQASGTLQAGQHPALTGDVTSTAGSLTTTLATVNTNTGSFGSSTAIPTFTVNGKGLITAAGTAAVVAPAGTLSGTTLNSTVVSSSLTSVGTITSGTWNGTAIVPQYGGTGLATLTPYAVLTGGTTATGTLQQVSGVGTAGQFLTSNGPSALPSWQSGLTNPMTTGGDMIYGGTSGAPTRLANGTLGQVLTSGGGTAAPTWNIIKQPIEYITYGTAEYGATNFATYNNTQAVTITIATPAVFTVTSTTGMYVGQPHQFTTTGALPTGLTAGTTYYISSIVSGTTFQVSASLGGTSVATSGTQSGTHTDRPMTPLNGTGGTANITWTTTTTSPLRGTTSFLLTKDANNRAGEGVAYPFTTALEDSAKVMQITVPYIVNSGTFVAGSQTTDSDIEVWIYDVTNATLIQPSTYKFFSNSATVPSALVANFQTASNSTSYRLLLHVNSNNAAAYVLKFDDISVAPTQYSLGTVITDWVERGPLVITAQTTAPGKGTVAFDGFLTRRVGGNLEYLYTFNQTTAGTTGSGIYFYNMPSGYVIDTSKIQLVTASTTSIQPGTILGNGKTGIVGTEGDWAMFQAYSSTQLIMTTNSSGSSSVLQVSSTWNSLNVANKFYTISGSIPILGWSVQQQTSDINDQRIVVARYYDNTGSAISTTQPMNYSVKDIDTHSAVTVGSAWKFTAPIAGVYSVSVTGQVSGTAGTCLIYKNGTATTQVLFEIENPNIIAGTQLISLNAGDYIDIRSTASSNATTTPTGVNAVSIMRVANPAQISTTETVKVSYWMSSNFAASTTVPINFDSKEFDSHGAYVPSTTAAKFTAPIQGTYQISGYVGSVSGTAVIYVYKNGVQYKSIGYVGGAGSVPSEFCSLIVLNAGDYIDIRPGAGVTFSGGTLATGSNFGIIKIGNN